MPKSVVDLSTIVPIVEPIVRAHGGEIYDLQWLSEPGGWVLRVLVEKQGSAAAKLGTEASAVSLELCSNVARELSPALDVSEMVGHRYSLEVSSPGIERPLRRQADYERFVDTRVKIKLKNPILPIPVEPSSPQKAPPPAPKGERVVTGTLVAGEAGAWRVDADNGKSFAFTLEEVADAHLVFEFGSKKTARKTSKKTA